MPPIFVSNSFIRFCRFEENSFSQSACFDTAVVTAVFRTAGESTSENKNVVSSSGETGETVETGEEGTSEKAKEGGTGGGEGGVSFIGSFTGGGGMGFAGSFAGSFEAGWFGGLGLKENLG